MAAHPEPDLFEHVRDSHSFHLPFGEHIPLPNVFGLQLTKYMVLQLVAGFFLLIVFRGLARRVASGAPPKGPWWNFWEMLALYIRDNVVRPTIGVPHDAHGHDDHRPDPHAELPISGMAPIGIPRRHDAHAAAADVGHPADRFLPYIWTCFFYVLICNLLGAFPWMGSPTANINVTGALAAITVCTVMFYGMQRSGVAGFWASLSPHMDLSPLMKLVLVPVIWGIELVGFVIKHGVLAVRLFANMMGGHTVIAVLLLYIATTATSALWYLVLPSSIFGQIFVGALELLVAFIQAYIFAFLATLFISMAVNPH
ncbi:MAG TPA: F0F1 ATP synthase subunit A [Planctomycetaceae bacterium]|jgi:F-type H+-transporting ATPase subunit a|nr:F0F1 ATP synthase subunit A [Planctomycetaceae bacterium]